MSCWSGCWPGPAGHRKNLGDRLNALAAALDLRARVHRRTPRRWIHPDPGRTAPRVPRDPWPSLVCHLLHERLGEPVTLGSLGWTAAGALTYVPADDGLDQPWNPPRGSSRTRIGGGC
jgi:hypothetical protein